MGLAVINMTACSTRYSHTALFYRDVQEFTHVSALLAEAGCRASEAVLVAATSSSLEYLRPKREAVAASGSSTRSATWSRSGADGQARLCACT
jgi:hypothetical protein